MDNKQTAFKTGEANLYQPDINKVLLASKTIDNTIKFWRDAEASLKKYVAEVIDAIELSETKSSFNSENLDIILHSAGLIAESLRVILIHHTQKSYLLDLSAFHDTVSNVSQHRNTLLVLIENHQDSLVYTLTNIVEGLEASSAIFNYETSLIIGDLLVFAKQNYDEAVRLHSRCGVGKEL